MVYSKSAVSVSAVGHRAGLTGPQRAVINCGQSGVYVGDRRSNLVLQAPLFGNKPQRTVSFPNLIMRIVPEPGFDGTIIKRLFLRIARLPYSNYVNI